MREGGAVAREELDAALGRLVAAEQAVIGVEAAFVDRGGEDVVEAVDRLGARRAQKALGALAGVDVAAEDVLRMVEDGGGTVCEDNFPRRPPPRG